MKRNLDILRHPSRLVAAFLARYCTWLPDETFLKWRYRLLMHKSLHINDPITFNEKIQWLKLYNRKVIYSTMADKSMVKAYVADIVGDEIIIPTLGIWDKFDDIDFDSLPNKFVLKSTNGGGGSGVIICKDKFKLDRVASKKCLENSMSKCASTLQGEWVYKDIAPRIIAEELLEDIEGGDIKDYKFFCFNGNVRCFKIDFGRYVEHHANYYDIEGNILPFGEAVCPPNFEKEIPIPDNLSKMVNLAEILSEGIPFLRVDFYNVNSKIYFGEFTFYPNS